MQNLAPPEVKALVEARRGLIAQLRTSNLMMMVIHERRKGLHTVISAPLGAQ